MSRRTIYVSQHMNELYDQAAVMAGSFSAAVEHGIIAYVQAMRDRKCLSRTVEVQVGRHRAMIRKRFEGMELGDVPTGFSVPGRVCGATLYWTRRGQIAAWLWSEPDWAASHRPDAEFCELDEPWDDEWDPLHDDWFSRHGEAFHVSADPRELCAVAQLPDEARELIEAHYRPAPIEYLDI